MLIADNNEVYGDTPVTASYTSPTGLAPGQSFATDPVYLKNVGSIDIKYVFGTNWQLNESQANFAKQFKLVAYLEIGCR